MQIMNKWARINNLLTSTNMIKLKRTNFLLQWQSAISSVAVGVLPYPLSCHCDTVYCFPRTVTIVCNHFCQRPALVIKIRGIPSGIQNAAAFPSFISYLPVASGAEYSDISASIVFPGYWQNSSVSWYKVGGGVSPITIRSEALTVSKHFHFVVTSECCGEILRERQIFFYYTISCFWFIRQLYKWQCSSVAVFAYSRIFISKHVPKAVHIRSVYHRGWVERNFQWDLKKILKGDYIFVKK